MEQQLAAIQVLQAGLPVGSGRSHAVQAHSHQQMPGAHRAGLQPGGAKAALGRVTCVCAGHTGAAGGAA